VEGDSRTYCTSTLAEGLRNTWKITAMLTLCRVAFSKRGCLIAKQECYPLDCRNTRFFQPQERRKKNIYAEISMPLIIWSSNIACDFDLVLYGIGALKFGQCLLCSCALFVICCRSSEIPSSPAQIRHFASTWRVGAGSKVGRINAYSE
jgi:hypothetical protein